MKIIVSGRNIDLTKALKDRVTEKFNRLREHFDFILEIHIFLSVEKNPSIRENQRAEVTIHVSGAVIRLEATSVDLYGSIDKLFEKAERSLGKHKTKLLHRAKSGRSAGGESIRRQAEALENAAVATAEMDTDLDNESEFFYTYSDSETSETEE